MSESKRQPPLARRSFLSRLSSRRHGAGRGGRGPGGAGGSTAGGRQPVSPGQARRRTIGSTQSLASHRLVFDTTSAEGLASAMSYARNYLQASERAYSLKSSELAVVIIARHLATVFAYTDAMWAKYPLAQLISFTDRRTKESPTTNLYTTGRDNSLDTLAKAGVQFAVCEMATRVFAEGLARRTSGDADAIHKDLMSNLIANSHPVTAGIVTVNRAQERGYTLAHGG